MAKKRVLVFSLAWHPVVGGAEIAVREIVSRIPDIEFDIITLRFDASHPAQEDGGNFRVYRIKSSKNLFPLKAFLLASKLHKKEHYDATWAIMANWAGLAALFFKFRFPKVPFVLTLQEGDPLGYIERKVRFIKPLFRKIFTKADKIQAISNYLAEWARSMGGKNAVVIPNGVDINRFEARSPKIESKDTVQLITTSRLVEKNGVGYIVEAMKFLPENVSLKILGTGPLEPALKAEVASNNLGARVEFVGSVPYEEIPKYLHEADIFVRPSLSEGMGNSFIEAMAAGLPVIATPVGGIPDFLKDGETGLFTEPKNPRLLAFQIQKLISDRVLRDKITINAKRMVMERYDWGLIAEEMRSKVFDI